MMFVGAWIGRQHSTVNREIIGRCRFERFLYARRADVCSMSSWTDSACGIYYGWFLMLLIISSPRIICIMRFVHVAIRQWWGSLIGILYTHSISISMKLPVISATPRGWYVTFFWQLLHCIAVFKNAGGDGFRKNQGLDLRLIVGVAQCCCSFWDVVGSIVIVDAALTVIVNVWSDRWAEVTWFIRRRRTYIVLLIFSWRNISFTIWRQPVVILLVIEMSWRSSNQNSIAMWMTQYPCLIFIIIVLGIHRCHGLIVMLMERLMTCSYIWTLFVLFAEWKNLTRWAQLISSIDLILWTTSWLPNRFVISRVMVADSNFVCFFL
jgi:hypothetical protein